MKLENSFESDLRKALQEDVRHELVGKQGSLVHQFIQRAHDILREYGRRHDYDVEPIIESLEQPEVTEDRGVVSVRVGWSHPAAPYMALGTSDHTINGDPVLSFVWEDPPAWVRRRFEQEGDGFRVFFKSVEVSGLPESRFVRNALHWLRREVT